ncbi:MAG: DUF192 domain-containing protein [bacterium]|nr:DUF192 domain-containing protein [bacterium]
MKKVFFAFALFFILALGMAFAQNYLKTKNLIPKKIPTATIDGHTFELRVARSEKEKEIGLSETESLPENKAMIFLFEKPAYYSFWMKNMTMPIDIIYINNDEIVTIEKNVQPPTSPTESLNIFMPAKPANRVLEIQAGLSEKYNFKEGDKVKYENLSN